MSDTAELKEKVRIAEIKVKEAVYAADQNILTKRRAELAALESQLDKLDSQLDNRESQITKLQPAKEVPDSFLGQLVAATTEDAAREVILGALEGIDSWLEKHDQPEFSYEEALEECGNIAVEVLGLSDEIVVEIVEAVRDAFSLPHPSEQTEDAHPGDPTPDTPEEASRPTSDEATPDLSGGGIGDNVDPEAA